MRIYMQIIPNVVRNKVLRSKATNGSYIQIICE